MADIDPKRTHLSVHVRCEIVPYTIIRDTCRGRTKRNLDRQKQSAACDHGMVSNRHIPG
jgi:hypothetical protein